MRESLVIQMPQDPAADAHWVVLGENGRVVGFQQSGPLAQAARKAGGRSVIVLVPAEDVLLTRVNIPTQKRQRLLRAVPYALEDQVADDVETLHFAVGSRNDAEELAVAVVSRASMNAWQARLSEAELTAEMMLADAELVPRRDSGWNVVLDGTRALVRCGDMDPFASDRDGLEIILEAAARDLETPPENIGVYHCGEAAAGAPVGFSGLEAREMPCEGGALIQLVRHYAPEQLINLLQGDYSQSEKLAQLWRPWRLTAGLLGVGVLLLFVSHGVEYFKLQKASAQLDASIEQVYRQAFPDAVRIVNPRLQMEQRLKELRNAQGTRSAGFIGLLAASGTVLRQVPGVQVDGVSYRNGNLDLELMVKNLQTLDTLKQRLVEGGELDVDIQSAVAGEDQRVQSRLRLSGART